MDLSEIPFNEPVIIWSVYKKLSLQNPLGSKKARCLSDNRDIYEQLILRHVRDDKVAIQSVRNGRFLHVRTNGECVFDLKQPGPRELFSMETDSSCALYFVSQHTGTTLQCSPNCDVRCVNENRLGGEAWRIVEPRTMTQVVGQLQILAQLSHKLLNLELARSGNTPEQIEQIGLDIFDAPLATVTTVNVALEAEEA
ncbi:hypothetical protein CCR75_001480 [Bremia lactucae]|uniref:Uncharacterized protein n=1 Tax=Bremia lactucae TaxID=4779 RepID=A0A976IM63_BRELC|nr:hypothetical protein CCR75_001480 [Bremia lactucae]